MFKKTKILKENNKKLMEQCSKVAAENVKYQKTIQEKDLAIAELTSINIDLGDKIEELSKEVRRLKTLLTKNNISYKKENKNGNKRN
jgi:hypothetical protein